MTGDDSIDQSVIKALSGYRMSIAHRVFQLAREVEWWSRPAKRLGDKLGAQSHAEAAARKYLAECLDDLAVAIDSGSIFAADIPDPHELFDAF